MVPGDIFWLCTAILCGAQTPVTIILCAVATEVICCESVRVAKIIIIKKSKKQNCGIVCIFYCLRLCITAY